MVKILNNVTKSGRSTLLSTHGLSATFLVKGIRLFHVTVLTFLVFTTFMPTAEAATPGIKFEYPNRRSGITTSIPLPRSSANETEFDWNKLAPSPNLRWVNCKAGRECARLEVPLDYSSPNGEKAAVALIRIKSKVPPDSEKYRGPVLFNPGGPGDSGVSFIDEEGEMFQQVLGDGYDIVGFDPRGVGQTTPPISVFSDTAERAAWDGALPPLINSTQDALSRSFARAVLLSQLVEARNKNAAQHASTAVVARDMLSIVKAHGRDRLQYWGFSYGSILGATYAAMFPDKVERLIIDGVLDFDDYLSGSWSKNLIDTEKGLQFLYDKCASAGSVCPLHAESGALVRERVDALLASVKANPFPVTNGSDYAIIDFSILKFGILQALYSPFELFPVLVGTMAALEAGDGKPALELSRILQPIPRCDPPPPSGSFGFETRFAVACGEADSVANSTAQIMQHFEELSKFSTMADIWTDGTYTVCAGWRVKAAERFAGPFTANTSFPLLVIGNTADPVTPLAGAQKAAQGFGNSRLLTINTPGHSSLASTSRCATTIIHDYFNTGKLPEQGKICEIESVLFGQNSTANTNSTAAGTELFQRSSTHNFQSSRFSRLL